MNPPMLVERAQGSRCISSASYVYIYIVFMRASVYEQMEIALANLLLVQ